MYNNAILSNYNGGIFVKKMVSLLIMCILLFVFLTTPLYSANSNLNNEKNSNEKHDLPPDFPPSVIPPQNNKDKSFYQIKYKSDAAKENTEKNIEKIGGKIFKENKKFKTLKVELSPNEFNSLREDPDIIIEPDFEIYLFESLSSNIKQMNTSLFITKMLLAKVSM